MASPLKMDSEEVPLEVDPLDLKFPLDPEKKKTSCTLRLSNKTVGIVAFKLKSTKIENYNVLPSHGIVRPRSTRNVIVTTMAPKKAPSDMQCEDKFLIQSIVVHEYDIEKHIIKDKLEESSEKVCVSIKRPIHYTSPVAESSSCSSHKPCALESHAETSASADAVKQEEKLELIKKTLCTFDLCTKTDGIFAFKLRAMKPENYCVIPNYGIMMPRSTCYVTVTTRAPEKAPSDMQCEDKILIKKIIVHEYDIEKHIIKNMFEESSEKVFEQNMRVLFMSPVAESSSCSSHDPCALESHAETSASADAVKEEEKLEVYDNDA